MTMKSLCSTGGFERTGAIILGGVDCHRGPVLSSRPRLPYLSSSSRRALDVVRFRADFGKTVRVDCNKAHWHVACRLRDLASPEIFLTDLDIFEAGLRSGETSSKLCQGVSKRKRPTE